MNERFVKSRSTARSAQKPPTFAGTARSAPDKRRGAPRALQQVTERSMVLGRLPLYGELEASPDCSQASSLSAEEIVVVYHERTKHHYQRFAASVGYMDWATQPDPFRCYEGASLVRLPFPEMGQPLPYWQLYVADSMEPAPLSIDSVSLFLRYALSLTAWKRFHETTCSLRATPRAETCTRRRDMRSCLPLAPSTTVPASTTTHRRNTVSSVEPTSTRRSGLP